MSAVGSYAQLWAAQATCKCNSTLAASGCSRAVGRLRGVSNSTMGAGQAQSDSLCLPGAKLVLLQVHTLHHQVVKIKTGKDCMLI